MSTVRSAKLVGIICIIAVLSAMYQGGLAIGIMLFAALPAAVVCRKKMNEEERTVQELLKRNHAVCAFRGDCCEGTGELKKTEECLIFFKSEEIYISYGENGSILLPLSQVREVHIQEMRYLEIEAEEEDGDVYVISFSALSEYANFNRLAMKKRDTAGYVMELK